MATVNVQAIDDLLHIDAQVWLEDCGAVRATKVEPVRFERAGNRWFAARDFSLWVTKTCVAERLCIRTDLGDFTFPVHCDKDSVGLFMENGRCVLNCGQVDVWRATIALGKA